MLSSSTPPDAFVCWSQEIFTGVLAASNARGLSVPRDVSAIASCAASDERACSLFLQPCQALGRALFEALRKRIADPFADVSGFVKPQFIDHASV